MFKLIRRALEEMSWRYHNASDSYFFAKANAHHIADVMTRAERRIPKLVGYGIFLGFLFLGIGFSAYLASYGRLDTTLHCSYLWLFGQVCESQATDFVFPFVPLGIWVGYRLWALMIWHFFLNTERHIIYPVLRVER